MRRLLLIADGGDRQDDGWAGCRVPDLQIENPQASHLYRVPTEYGVQLLHTLPHLQSILTIHD